jgi:hypothetical protein
VKDLARRAIELLEHGEPAKALQLLESGGAGDSTELAVLLAYTDALEQLRRADEAISLIERVSTRVREPGLLIRGAGLSAAKGDRARRDAFLSTADERFPNTSLVLAALADAASDDGDSDRAIPLLERTIACHDPTKGPPVAHLLALNAELCRVGRPREGHRLLEAADRRAATMPVTHSARLMTAHYYLPELGASDSSRQATLEASRDDHRRFGDRFGVPIATRCRGAVRAPGRKLRVGYVSPDFRNHSVARFIVPILRAHDRERVEVFCYSSTLERHDDVTASIASSSAKFVDLCTLGEVPAAALIAEDALDVVVDLAGHTGPHQLSILSRRVAPVQLTFLGYPDVTGLPEMDGFITDAVASPPGADAFTVEPLVRLPHTAWTFDPQVEELETSRLPSSGVVFGALHNLSKITDPMLQLWAGILSRVPGSTLTLSFRTKSTEGRRAFVHRLETAGLPEARVTILEPVSERSRHIERMRSIDVVLDTFPYAGTTTTCEALWMGVPVVTLAGATHASRVGASLVDAVGLSDLAASTPESYVEAAVALALDGPRRATLRATLRDRMRASPLGDAAAFTRSLEALYERVYAERAALPGFDLVATGIGRHATVDGARLVLPSELGDPASFGAVEREQLDEGELAFARDALPSAATCIDVLPGTGLQSLALARSRTGAAVVHVFDPLPTPTTSATLRTAPNVRASDVLPGQRSGTAALGPRSVAVAPLDDLVSDDAALIRLGAPGLEVDVLRGAKRLLSKGALVMLERGFQPLGPAASMLASLGLVPHGLVPLLGALARVGPEDSRRVVFAVSSACRARFGAALRVIDDTGAPPDESDADAASPTVRGGRGGPLPPGVAAFVQASRPELDAPTRLAWLRAAVVACERDVRSRPTLWGPRLSLCRALFELGDLGQAGAALEPLMGEIDAPLDATMDEPFLPALRRYDALPSDDAQAWLRAQLIEAFVKLSAPSSFFHPPEFLQLFARFDTLGFPDREMDRREALLRSRKEM